LQARQRFDHFDTAPGRAGEKRIMRQTTWSPRQRVCSPRHDGLLSVLPRSLFIAFPEAAVALSPLPYHRPTHPLMPSPATIERFLAHCHRRRYPPRTDIFRPGDPAGTMYYVINGSVSIIAEEDDDRELVLGYFGNGEFVGEMGMFIQSETRAVILRTRTQCELAEISYERLQALFEG